jgi:site-specific DNA recombinase
VLGYDVDRSGPSPKLVINAEEAARVRRIVSLYLELGSLLPVVEELARRGWSNKSWKTKRGIARGGRMFDKCSVYALLTNPIYIGKIAHKGASYEGEHEAIVDSSVFQKVQTTLQQHGHGRGNHLINKYGALLKGLVRCQTCGHAMFHSVTKRGSKRYRYYVCVKALKNGRSTCRTKSLPAAEIEAAVVDQIRCIARDSGLRDEVLRQARKEVESNICELTTQRQQLERQLGRDHAEIRRLVEVDQPSSATTALVARVEFDATDSTIAITFHPSAIKTLAETGIEDAA